MPSLPAASTLCRPFQGRTSHCCGFGNIVAAVVVVATVAVVIVGIIRHVYDCYCHPSQLPLHSWSLLLLLLLLPTHHHHPPSLLANANTRCCHLPLLLLNVIFAAVTFSSPSNALKHCCCNQTPLLATAIVHCHSQTLLSIAPLSIVPPLPAFIATIKHQHPLWTSTTVKCLCTQLQCKGMQYCRRSFYHNLLMIGRGWHC